MKITLVFTRDTDDMDISNFLLRTIVRFLTYLILCKVQNWLKDILAEIFNLKSVSALIPKMRKEFLQLWSDNAKLASLSSQCLSAPFAAPVGDGGYLTWTQRHRTTRLQSAGSCAVTHKGGWHCSPTGEPKLPFSDWLHWTFLPALLTAPVYQQHAWDKARRAPKFTCPAVLLPRHTQLTLSGAP